MDIEIISKIKMSDEEVGGYNPSIAYFEVSVRNSVIASFKEKEHAELFVEKILKEENK